MMKVFAASLPLFSIMAVGQSNLRTASQCVLLNARDGQTVTVKGEARSTAHDLMFDVEGCNESVLLRFAGDEDTDLSRSELRRDSQFRRFNRYTSSVYRSSGKNLCIQCAKYGDVRAELVGKLQIAAMPDGATKDRLGFIRDQSGKVVGKFGWGHPSPFAAYRLVITSASHVKAQKLPPPT